MKDFYTWLVSGNYLQIGILKGSNTAVLFNKILSMTIFKYRFTLVKKNWNLKIVSTLSNLFWWKCIDFWTNMQTTLIQSFVSNSFWLVSFWNFWNLMFLRKDNCVEFLQYATPFKFRQCWILWKCKKPVKNAGLCKDHFRIGQTPTPNINL